MDFVRKLIKPITPFVAASFLWMSLIIPKAQAEMVDTQSMVEKQTVEQQRDRIKNLYDRQDVQKSMKSHGLSAKEAQTRINNMTDREVMQVAKRIDSVPAGAGAEVLLLLILILIILEATGVTNIFTFI